MTCASVQDCIETGWRSLIRSLHQFCAWQVSRLVEVAVRQALWCPLWYRRSVDRDALGLDVELRLGNLLVLHGQRQAVGIRIGALASRCCGVLTRNSGLALVDLLPELIAHNRELDRWVLWISASVTE